MAPSVTIQMQGTWCARHGLPSNGAMEAEARDASAEAMEQAALAAIRYVRAVGIICDCPQLHAALLGSPTTLQRARHMCHNMERLRATTFPDYQLCPKIVTDV